jgi:hypothetical protein
MASTSEYRHMELTFVQVLILRTSNIQKIIGFGAHKGL